LRVLVTGGAGYIGSHAARELLDAGHEVTILDDLSVGHEQALAKEARFVSGDLGDPGTLRRALEGAEAVMHFAALAYVGVSVRDPAVYYRTNVVKALQLLWAMLDAGVTRLVFSSTCATYGMPSKVPIPEDHPTAPINPYGWSKLMSEQMLRDIAAVTPLAYVALRYFNVAGADPGGRIGQSTPEATHLIKVAAEHVVGKRKEISIFGTDYDTPDGTCIRDYIHIEDLAAAHLQALDYLRGGGGSTTLNCGYGQGFSVREVLREVERVSGTRLNVVESGRREGDPPQLVAAARRIRDTLGWTPRHADLAGIVATALAWEKRLLRQPMA